MEKEGREDGRGEGRVEGGRREGKKARNEGIYEDTWIDISLCQFITIATFSKI